MLWIFFGIFVAVAIIVAVIIEVLEQRNDEINALIKPLVKQRKEETEQTCSNCKHYAKEYELCCYSLGDEDYDCRGRKWEIKEK